MTYGDKQTNIETITCGVPLGSILGPLLFLIFVNDLHKVTKYLDPIMFVDDTNLVCRRYKLVTEWFVANKLSLNAKNKQSIFYFIK